MNLFETKDYYEKINTIGKGKHAAINVGETYKTNLKCDVAPNTQYTLQLRGMIDALPRSWRTEDKYPVLYRRLSEALRGGILTAKGSGLPISRNIYYKAYRNEIGDIRQLKYELQYKIDGTITSGATVVEVNYNVDSTRTIESNCAEIVESRDLELTTNGEWRKIQFEINSEEEVDFVYIRVETEGLDGSLELRAPKLCDIDGNNILKPFEKEKLELVTPRWIGENFSRIEWVPFVVKINGTEIFNGEKFDRIYIDPAFEFVIPQGLLKRGNNTLEVTYPKVYEEQTKFNLASIKLISNIDNGIVWYESTVALGEFPVLIKAKAGNKISLKGDKNIAPITQDFTADSDGMHVVKYLVKEEFEGARKPIVGINGTEYEVNISRYLVKNDNVLVGTGDTIYIDLIKEDFDRFLPWYLANKAGNMITFRTSYRWSGCTYSLDSFWQYIGNILDSMQIHYNIMIDGRELNSAKSNSDGFKGGEYFDGYQSHEQDGAYLYWRSHQVGAGTIFFNELCSRRLLKQGMLPSGSVVRKGDKFYKHFDSATPRNMKEASEQLVNNFRRMTLNSTRHTGPSIMFKYIAEAGINYLGAELMYGSYDPIIAALRGAARSIGQENYGGHIAIQWSTTPHDTIYRYRRYLLSLYNCYINGVHNINTEEGLYRMEEHLADTERDSEACLNHAAVERNFYEFVRNHNRRGRQKVDFGFLYGKYDGVNGFFRGNVYAMRDSDWKFAAPEKSWDLVNKVFYNYGKYRSLYYHPCFNFNNGYFTKTRYGQVDVVPIESSLENMSDYRTLAFLGWNTADEDMIDKLYDYVEGGGTLVLAAPHLYTTVERERALTHSSHVLLNDKVKKLLGIASLKRDSRVVLGGAEECGNKLRVAPNEVLCNKLGGGCVYFVNHFKYPYEIKTLYARIMEQLARENIAKEADKGVVTTDDFVTTSIFDADDRRVINMLDMRWWRKRKSVETASVTFDGYSYKLGIVRDVLNQVSIFKDAAIVTADTTTDIVARRGNTFILQGEGIAKVKVLHKGKVDSCVVDFTDRGRAEIIVKQ